MPLPPAQAAIKDVWNCLSCGQCLNCQNKKGNVVKCSRLCSKTNHYMEELHISQDLLSAAHSDTAQKCQHILQATQDSKWDVWTPQTTPTIKSQVSSSTFFLAQNSLPLPGRGGSWPGLPPFFSQVKIHSTFKKYTTFNKHSTVWK